MGSLEPHATALLLATFGTLLGAAVLFSRAGERTGLPLALLFLGLGMLAGSEGLGGIAFEDYRYAFRLGTVALVLILFDGGLNTPLSVVRETLAPASVLATIGVAGTAAVVAVGAHVLGFGWPESFLVGAIVSSTDAAAVFSVLRTSGIHLKRRVGGTLEVESGINDPMAVILTTVLTANLVAQNGGSGIGWGLIGEVGRELAVGLAVGVALGYGGRWVVAHLRLPATGLYPALTLAVACLTFGLATLLHGSGFLAVYIAGLLLGDSSAIPYRPGVLRVHDALAWLSQIAMFLILGLLVFPSRLIAVAPIGLALGLLLALIARPAVVALCLAPFRYPMREVGYIGWVGLRGAVPIILATFPVLASAPGAHQLFDIVFFVVVVNAIIPGTTVPWITRRLRLASDDPPPPRAVLQIESTQPLRGELSSFFIDDALAVAGQPLSELPFPDGASVTLIVRDREVIPPKGTTTLNPGDHVYIFSRPEDAAFIRLLFGGPETED